MIFPHFIFSHVLCLLSVTYSVSSGKFGTLWRHIPSTSKAGIIPRLRYHPCSKFPIRPRGWASLFMWQMKTFPTPGFPLLVFFFFFFFRTFIYMRTRNQKLHLWHILLETDYIPIMLRKNKKDLIKKMVLKKLIRLAEFSNITKPYLDFKSLALVE